MTPFERIVRLICEFVLAVSIIAMVWVIVAVAFSALK
jgi:hypothetical protein